MGLILVAFVELLEATRLEPARVGAPRINTPWIAAPWINTARIVDVAARIALTWDARVLVAGGVAFGIPGLGFRGVLPLSVHEEQP